MVREAGEREKRKDIIYIYTRIVYTSPLRNTGAHFLEWGAEKKNQIEYYDNRFLKADLRGNPDYAQYLRV
jgi:sulfoacetaldehyde acetyltransferase